MVSKSSDLIMSDDKQLIVQKFVCLTIPSIILLTILVFCCVNNYTHFSIFKSIATAFQFASGVFLSFGYICQIIKIWHYSDLSVVSTFFMMYGCFLFEFYAFENLEVFVLYFISNTCCMLLSTVIFIQTTYHADIKYKALLGVLTYIFIVTPYIMKVNRDFCGVCRLLTNNIEYIATGFVLCSSLITDFNLIFGNYITYSLKNASIVTFSLILFSFYAVSIGISDFIIISIITSTCSFLQSIIYVICVRYYE